MDWPLISTCAAVQSVHSNTTSRWHVEGLKLPMQRKSNREEARFVLSTAQILAPDVPKSMPTKYAVSSSACARAVSTACRLGETPGSRTQGRLTLFICEQCKCLRCAFSLALSQLRAARMHYTGGNGIHSFRPACRYSQYATVSLPSHSGVDHALPGCFCLLLLHGDVLHGDALVQRISAFSEWQNYCKPASRMIRIIPAREKRN